MEKLACLIEVVARMPIARLGKFWYWSWKRCLALRLNDFDILRHHLTITELFSDEALLKGKAIVFQHILQVSLLALCQCLLDFVIGCPFLVQLWSLNQALSRDALPRSCVVLRCWLL